jgi:hypothetical protein
MKSVVIGAHLERGDVEPVADVIRVNDLWLSALPVADDQPLGDRELLLRVAQARAALLDRQTFIAIRYGLAVRSSEDAAAKCAEHLEQWRRLLRTRRGMVEMTLKVAAVAPKVRPDRNDFDSGSAYFRALHETTRSAEVDPEFRRAADSRLIPLSIKSRWANRDQSSLEFAALVLRSSVDAVNDAGAALKRDFPAVPFLLSGPWPLEVFADDHE